MIKDQDLVSHLVEKVQASPDFSQDEVRVLRVVIETYKGLEAFGRFAVFVQKAAVVVGGIAAAYLALKHGLVDWVRAIK